MKLMISSKTKKILGALGILSLLGLSAAAFADVNDVGQIAVGVADKFSGIGKMFLAVAYVCGFGFALIAIFKFKSHKDNPQQTALGVPVSLLCIGMALIFLPTVLGASGKSVFGDDRTASSFTGDHYDDDLSGS